MVRMQSFAIWIQTASLFMCKQMTITKILPKILKQDLTLQILKQITFTEGKNEKVIRLMKDELGVQTMNEFV